MYMGKSYSIPTIILLLIVCHNYFMLTQSFHENRKVLTFNPYARF